MSGVTSTDEAATLAREARDILRAVMAHAAPSGQPNGLVVSATLMRFALRDRLDRLCAALGVENADEEHR